MRNVLPFKAPAPFDQHGIDWTKDPSSEYELELRKAYLDHESASGHDGLSALILLGLVSRRRGTIGADLAYAADFTAVIVTDGITIGGKTMREHLDAVNGEKAYRHMLQLAQDHAKIDEEVIKDLHAYAVGPEQQSGGLYRNDQRYISGSRYVPPAWAKVRAMMKAALAEYAEDLATAHPVATAAKLHYDIAAIHPFPDYNGRTARLAMNLHLVEHGFPPISIVPGDQRSEYFQALEAANFHETPSYPNRQGNPAPFTAFIAKLVEKELNRYLTVLHDLA